MKNLTFAVFQVIIKNIFLIFYLGCDKRFTQSSNLTAHEKTHKEQLTKPLNEENNVDKSEMSENKNASNPIFIKDEIDSNFENIEEINSKTE